MAFASVPAAAALLAACDDDKGPTVDANEVEQAIKQDLSSGTTEIKSVLCPDDVRSETGARDGAATVTFEFSDASGSIDESSVGR